MNKRHSLIMAALCGCSGDDSCSWQSPIDEATLISWAKSHHDPAEDDNDDDNFKSALDELVEEGLFFKVHQAVFETPTYFCMYDGKFIEELPDLGDENKLEECSYWADMAKEYDKEFGDRWRECGICAGGGSQSGSNPEDICQGKNCCCYTPGTSECNWDLKFKIMANS